jgi:hypothetical protein
MHCIESTKLLCFGNESGIFGGNLTVNDVLNVSEKHTASIFKAEDGDSMFLRNFDIYLRIYTALNTRRTPSSSPP